ncbi:hypothetical protein CR513_16989, partial [Mucuna pruriens]
MVPLEPLEPPYLRSYDPNARCDYHGGAIGHTTKRCWSLKHKVQDLIKGGYLGFQYQGSNVKSNLLPTHRDVTINVIRRTDHKQLSQRGPVGGEEEKAKPNAPQTRPAGWRKDPTKDSQTKQTYVGGSDNPRQKPLIIYYNSASQPRVPFMVLVLAKPVYHNNAVPWRYPLGETTPSTIKEESIREVTNIARIAGMTQNGRVYAHEGLWNKDPAPERKDKAAEVPRRIVTEGEAIEFLKLICHSEYEMLDQMHKTPAQVSLLSLLINSEGHNSLLLKVLNDAHVAQDITPEKFRGIINNNTTSHHLSFSEDEVPVKGKSHN